MPMSLFTTLQSRWQSSPLRARPKPTELAGLLAAADGRERAELMDIISRHDAWDEVDGLVR